MILTTEYLERLIEQSRWLPVGLIRVYIEDGIVVRLDRTESGWLVSIRRQPTELPVNGTKNFSPPGWVPDYFTKE